MAPPPIELPPLAPLPKPSQPTKPKLTRAMKAGLDPMPAGAGGWTPSVATVAAIGGVGLVFGGMAPVLPQVIPGPLGIALGALCGAIAGGIVFFAAKSAGPRKGE